MTSAYVSEIYASVQGEGPFTGERQIFVRLAGCPLRCVYCDTPESLTVRGHKKWSDKEVIAKIATLSRQHQIKTISFTGGEPLAQSGFLEILLPELKFRGFKTYLETAGIHWGALKKISRFLDVISMDMKLPSAIGKSHWQEHAEFLKLGGRKIFVKIVLEKESSIREMSKAITIISKARPVPLLVLQPATSIKGQVSSPTAEQVADAFQLATKYLPRVLVMPQQHKIWGVR